MSKRRANAGEGYGFLFHGGFTKKKDAVEKEKEVKGSFVRGIPTNRGYRYFVMSPRLNPIKRKKNPKNPVVFDAGLGMYSAWRRTAGGTVYGTGHTKKAALHDLRDRLRRHRKGEPLSSSRGYFPGENPRPEFLYAAADHSGHRFTDWVPMKDYAIRQAKTYGGQLLKMNVSTGAESVERNYRRAGVRYAAPLENPMDLVVMGANPSRTIRLRPGERITIASEFMRRNPSGDLCGKLIGGLPCTREKGHRGPHLPQGATLRPASRHNWGPRSNPTAETIREDFIGAPVDVVKIAHEPHMPAGDYAVLGELLELWVKPVDGGQVQAITPRGTILASDQTARQLWFVGGNQSEVGYQLEAFGARDLGGGLYELGQARRIDYKQRKYHVAHPEYDEWKHPFGQESGVLPRALFDSKHKRLLLEGGEYRIEARGIVN